MKRAGFLYERISDYDNLLSAFHAASRGKRQQPVVQRFRDSLQQQIVQLREDFHRERLRLGDYHYFTIHDPKERLICAASFRERVIHHAVINVVGPVLERPLIDNTFACRPGKGQHRAARLACYFAHGHPYFLKMDVRKYFDSIEHVRVARQLRRLIKDAAVLRLFDRLLATYQTSPGRGLPIGNLTSQYLANLYLSPFDHFVNHELRCSSYVRYMDDFMLWGTRDEVRRWRPLAAAFLDQRLGLRLKAGGFINRCSHGCDFLGFRVFPDSLRLSRRSARRLRAAMRRLEMMFARGRIDERQLQQRATAVFAFAQSSDSRALLARVARSSHLEDY
ncbi:MAG: group II intron reverse transcriptase domain-containing protein [Pirellulaceae bacterium]|nr:group II intron reverse transcriptase domain-containing protein [Pirellulaceae bacterium]